MGLSYFENISFSICGLILLLLIISIAWFKRKTSKVSYRFVVISLVTGALLILEILCPYAITIRESNKFLSNLIIKGYLIFMYLYTFETLLVTSKVCSKNNKEFNGKKLLKYEAYAIGFILIGLVSLFLDIEFLIKDGHPYVVRGMVIIAHNIISAIISGYELTLFVKTKKNITMQAAKVFGVALAAYIVVIILEAHFNYYVTIAGSFYTLLLLCIYFTFESQDYIRYRQIETEIENLDASSKAKNDMLNKLYYEIRSESSLILDYQHYMIENTDYTEDTYQNMVDIIKNSANNLDATLNKTKDGE